eukprot:7793184-Alexandrium_andersonii.AAC.1
MPFAAQAAPTRRRGTCDLSKGQEHRRRAGGHSPPPRVSVAVSSRRETRRRPEGRETPGARKALLSAVC